MLFRFFEKQGGEVANQPDAGEMDQADDRVHRVQYGAKNAEQDGDGQKIKRVRQNFFIREFSRHDEFILSGRQIQRAGGGCSH